MSDAPVPVVTLDGIRIRGPERVTHRGKGVWLVSAVDPVLETVEEKHFTSKAGAQAFIAQLAGVPLVDPLAESAGQPSTSAKGGAPITYATATTLAAPAPPQLTRSHTRRVDPAVNADKQPDAAPFNLRAVRDVLIEYELDPFAEIAKVLQKTTRKLIRDSDGRPVLGPDGEQQYQEDDLITGRDRATILVELAQYIAPKLKSVEMKVEDKGRLTIEELDQRISAKLGNLDAGEVDQLVRLIAAQREPAK